ncbi:DNA repair protein RAD51 homolog 4 isoform X2 [Neodiprion pinetum]|nr:DNA repair protein RAD51 homolog 4 isoform X2 [Neodiprion pinetum]XP_046481191.1 DNA repair protein RAD51 homolog 4 isoform X2 [Neodiprion pinetum]XP_046481192.1 DNA repair protein RAD51 homolog 4 isoform X2 [Neodiprion pinetum]XP_046481193.1 DNA repair protein RAD51 homolog 4 isoform X2 [Neodiprion pinetum]
MARITTDLHLKLSESAVSNLQSKKIYTVFDLMSEDSEKLMQYSGLSYQDILDLKNTVTKLYTGKIHKGPDLLKASCNGVTKTGIQSLDYLLRGGLYAGQIHEVCGVSSSGKSQLCHTVAVNVAQNSDGIVHYIDTNADFSATRAQIILENKGCSEEMQVLVLERISVTRVKTIQEVLSLLHSFQWTNTKLVIIDSLPALFFSFDPDLHRFTYTYSLNIFSNLIRWVAGEFNIPIITTNSVTYWQNYAEPDSSPLKRLSSVKPTLGTYWHSVPNSRLLLENTKSEGRKITVWKSSYLPSGSTCYIRITNAGVV